MIPKYASEFQELLTVIVFDYDYTSRTVKNRVYQFNTADELKGWLSRNTNLDFVVIKPTIFKTTIKVEFSVT